MFRKYTIYLALSIVCAGVIPAHSDERTPSIQPKLMEIALPPQVEIGLPPGAASEAPMRPLTADEAASIALLHQPNIAMAKSNVSAAQGRESQARAGLYPSVGASAGYIEVNNSTSSSGTPGSSATGYLISSSVRQLIFDFNHTRDLASQASAQRASSDAALNKVESDTVFQVKQAFYGYLQSMRLVTVNEANVQNLQGHLALTRARLNAGVGLPSDVVRAQTAVADAIFALMSARNNASIARVNLDTLMGIDPRTPIQIADSTEPAIAEYNLDALVNRALKSRPEMVQATANLDASRHGVGVAQTGSMPSLVASAGWNQHGDTLPLENGYFSAGLSIQWNLFDSGLTAGKVKEAKSNFDIAEQQLGAIRLAVISDVSQAYLALKTDEQRVRTAEAEVSNAEESVRLTEGRYKVGLGTFLDVLDAQTALVTANTNLVNARSAIEQSKAALFHSIGVAKVQIASASL